jgi:hypothetical protein
MKDKAHLIIKIPAKGEPMVYQCSLCDQIFPLPEDGTPKEAMATIRATFQEHIRGSHQDDITSSGAQ